MLHPDFRARLASLAGQVEELKRRSPDLWEQAPTTKLFKRIVDLITKEIPSDPAASVYEQGNTLGKDARGWRRAKFLERFRLFFRFDTRSRVIVYAWVNDENTLRSSGSSTDPYAVFRAKLLSGDPPHNWEKLLDACRAAPAANVQQAVQGALGPMTPVPEKRQEQKPKHVSKGRRR